MSFKNIFPIFWARVRIVALSFNVCDLIRALRVLNSKLKPIVVFILYENSFQSPTGEGEFASRHLEPFFLLLKKMDIPYLVLKPLFSKGNFRRKTEKMISFDSIALLSLINKSRSSKDVAELTWERILFRLGPKLVFGQNLSPSVMKACTTIKIPTVEIQHGIWFEDICEVYSYSNEIGYAPDYFMIWHQFYETYINHLSSKKITIGYPANFKYLETQNQRQSMNLGVSNCNALVTLSVGVVNSADPLGLVQPEVNRVINQILDQGGKVLIRPHPLTGSNAISEHLKHSLLNKMYPQAQIVPFKKQDITKAIEGAAVVITYDGTVIIDALLNGTPVLYASPEAPKGLPECMLTSKLLREFNSPSQLMRSCNENSEVSTFDDWQFQEEEVRKFIERLL